ncbi:hypothetical protein CDL15_Pgr028492 [Punica granatum]|uniref:Pre-mRNA-processing protein 40A n=1 Tax=Punica granatum TaxID=22663 RepID=A0A218VWB9_PUNGR|nr:hypothetical protein CDL15_Pgr028492 [Punica granatum]PKI71617.1 hypothetical protein CRG98_007940 [Punica granatum]
MANNPQFSGFQPVRLPVAGSTDPPRSYAPPFPVQSFTAVPAANVGFPSIPQQPQFHSSVLPPRPQYTVQNALLPPGISVPISQTNNQVASESPYPQLIAPPLTNFVPSSIGLGAPLSSSFTFSPHGLQNQANLAAPRPAVQYPPMSQPHVSSVSSGDQSRLASESSPGSSIKPITDQSSASSAAAAEPNARPTPGREGPIDWIEHTSPDGRRYYYNKKTKQSSWQKPFELMTAIERADASTDWREYKSADGRMYYYNKVTKQSKWEMPMELKLARECITKSDVIETPSEMGVANEAPKSLEVSSLKSERTASIPATLEASTSDAEPAIVSTSSPLPTVNSAATFTAPVNEVSPDHSKQAAVAAAETAEAATETVDVFPMPMANPDDLAAQKDLGSSEIVSAPEKASEMASALEKAKDDEIIDEKAERTLEDKLVNHEPLPYANKLEARNAFKALLESANVGSDWTWERAMRVIITDKRYGALKSLGERKDTFNEFVSQRKKQEAEERRLKQKKAREDFKKMLEESKELTSSSKWSKIVRLFEDDERFKAVERERDRQELFDDYIDELEKQERAKAVEERKRSIMEYRQFLESCSFITSSSQWRKVQNRLEADERCSRLEKIDRLEIFQEELRKVERKNRDEFRKLMDEHIASGMLTAKTHWHDYHMKVKDLPAYIAVSSNTSGSTPEDLFEDVVEELAKQYEENKAQIEDALKLRKVEVSPTWTLEDLKAAIADDLRGTPISEINFKLALDELLDKIRRKEEKKRKRMGDKFFDLLHSVREITVSSTWEDCKHHVERSHEYSSIKDENLCQEIFEEYITALKEKEKEYERRHKEDKERERERYGRDGRSWKDRRGKDRHDREEEESRDDGVDDDNTGAISDKRKKSSSKDKDREKKHHKRRHSAPDNLDETDRDHSKRSHKHSSDHKKSKRGSSPESEGEARHKKQKRDHRKGSHRSSNREELEDGEFGS